MGADVLPAVDNVHTFADTFSIITTQGVFNPDTTIVSRSQDHVIGYTNDPLFGTTNATACFQFKPTFYPFYLGNAGDTISQFGAFGTGFDSAVLTLKYKGFYGDSTKPLQLEVREIVDNNFRDNPNTPHNVNYLPTLGNVIGSATVDLMHIGDTIKYVNNRDYSVNTIRIKLDQLWSAILFKQDSVAFHTGTNAFRSDSLYRQAYNGLAVVAKTGNSGNELIYVNLADAASRIEMHFRRRNNGSLDTTFTSLSLNSDYYGTPVNRSSNTCNNIVRNRPALPTGDQEIYLQTQGPGTYANLSIPGLTNLSNRFIHRAELIVEEIPDLSGSKQWFKGPSYLYLDLKDTGSTVKYKPIYKDLNPQTLYDPDYKNPFASSYFPLSGIDYLYFGGYRRTKQDQFGNTIDYYNMNITRYVQDIVTNHKPNYDLRLYAPFVFSYPQYAGTLLTVGNSVAYGRVKVGGGNNPNYKMRLRVVYSNL